MALNNFTGKTPGANPPGGPSGPGIPIGGGAIGSPSLGSTDPLELLIDYNKRFANAGTILFRDSVIQQTLSILIAKNKPNALLEGPAGCGKTKIVEDIAYRLASNDPLIPTKLQDMHIYELPLSNIVAGSSFVGQVEEKIKGIIDFACDPKNRVILFIDEIHQLCGESQTYDKIGQILKPALARGDMRVIGATTTQEAGMLMDDPALNRRFSRVIVDEFTQEQTAEILCNAKGGFMTHYGNKVSIDDSVMESIVTLADQYHSAGSHRPDNALTLLDRACGDAVIARKVAEHQALNDPTLAAALKAVPIIPITEKMVKRTAIKLMTGNAQKNDFDIDVFRDALSVIKGQDEAIEQILQMLRRNNMDLFPRTTPMTLLLAGSSGVGKTEVVKIIAERLTGVKPITLNMTEYHSPASINRIIGAPAGYIGSDSKAELPFDCLESNPYQVILLDEFEKGDKSVQRLFMSAFDEGYIKTSRGKIVDFSRAIIIATTNAGHSAGSAKGIGFGDANSKTTAAVTVSTLSNWFDTELLNRFQAILTFQDIDKPTYREIIAQKYDSELTRIKKSNPRISLPAAIPDDELDAIVERTYVSNFGARPAGKAVREFIESQV